MSTKEDKKMNINVPEKLDQKREEQLADMQLEGVLSSTQVIATYEPNGKVDATETLMALKRKTNRVINGKTEDMEALLMSQAVALDAIFTKLSLRAYSNFGHYIDAGDKYLRLALKAQSQCRATLESLSEIKNPRPYIQNNRAEYQQVNNGTVLNSKTNTPTHAHAEKSFLTNELLEDKTHEQEWLDTRTPTEAIRSD